MWNFNQLWAKLPAYPGVAQFHKPYSPVMQWSGRQMIALRSRVLPVFVVTPSNPSAREMMPFN